LLIWAVCCATFAGRRSGRPVAGPVPKATPEIAARRRAGGLRNRTVRRRCARAGARFAKIVAITGSNGKTTTTALTAHLLNGPAFRPSLAATSRRRRSMR
jgi:UDP-N-acetylmuramoylalanine--D-glutamate ligase